jgi:uncharacterized membrane protein YphA (DoxX/SURF4 family)
LKTRSVIYWISTVLIALAYIFGGISQVMRSPESVEGIVHHLGYPMHFLILLGVWKFLGGVAILVPRFPLVKEWAYAGMFIDATAASVALASAHDSVFQIIAPLVMAALLIVSWALRPESRRLPATERGRDHPPTA